MSDVTADIQTSDDPKLIEVIRLTIPLSQVPEFLAELTTSPRAQRTAEVYDALNAEYKARIEIEAAARFFAPEETTAEQDEQIKRGFIQGYLAAKGAIRA